MKRKLDPATWGLITFAFPMLLGNILQSCYSMADMAVVGRFVGRNALAAVSNTSMICFISNAICIGFTVAGNVLVAHYRGAGDSTAQRDTISTLFALSALGGILLTLVNYLLYTPVLRLMDIPEEAFGYAVEYMAIVSAGNFFVFGYNAVCSVMRGLGDSRSPIYFVAITAAVNIALDYLFTGAFHWGVRGAALATVTSQAASYIAALRGFRKLGKRNKQLALRPGRHSLHIDLGKCAAIIRLGLPTALRSSVLNISYLIITGLFNGYGTAAAAAAGIGLKVNTFVAMPCWAVGQAVTTIAGKSMGAKKPDEAGAAARKGIALSLLFTGVFLALIHIFIRPFLGMFSQDTDVIELGVLYLRICCSINFIPYVIMNVFDNFATGVGAPVLAMVNSLLHSVVFRLGLSLLFTLVLGYGYVGLCAAESVSPLVSCFIGVIYFTKGSWRNGGAIDANRS